MLPSPPPPHASLPSPQLHAAEHPFDAFLSYRRADWHLVDAIQDKLALRGVRAFKDVDGHLSGRPFDVELLLAVANAATFAPVITLTSLRRMASLRGDSPADTSLAEWLAALYFTSLPRGAHRAVRVRGVVPILVGERVPAAENTPNTTGGFRPAHWLSLRGDPSYGAALAQLCDEPSAATVRLTDAAMRRALGVPLPAEFAAMSVRAVVLGVLQREEAFELACADDHFDLYVRGRLAPALLAAARGS